jgi:futalosine hydrolase
MPSNTLQNVETPEVLLLCATEGEAGRLIAAMQSPVRTVRAGKTAMDGTLEGRNCRLVVGGMGMVNAASALTAQLERCTPALVLQFGIGGAYPGSGVAVGEVAVATEEVYGEVGVLTPEGWQPANFIGIPLVPGDPPRYNRFPLEGGMVSRAAALCGGTAGPFLTLSQCTGVGALGEALFRRFGAICENMEGAAAAHVCALYGVPFLEVRGISNVVEDRDRSRWKLGEAVRVAQEAALKVACDLDGLLCAKG